MTERVVVVGTGHGGVQTVDALRRFGWTGEIVLVGAEPHLPYHRPPLSKAFLEGSGEPAPVLFHEREHYDANEVQLRLGDAVVSIDRAERAMVTSSGERIYYDHAVLALGSRPRSLPAAVLGESAGDAANVLTLRSLDHAVALRARLLQSHSVVCVGGGFISLEVASVAAAMGRDVTVLEQDSRLLSRAVTPVTSQFLVDRHRAAGVTVRLGDGIARLLLDAGEPYGVETTSGVTLAADLVVVGVGGAPNTTLAEAAGLRVEDGVVVDTQLLTSDPAISAIGDCVRFPEGGALVRRESVQNAFDGATHVANRLTGRARGPYAPVPWFWTDQAGVKVQMAGRSGSDVEWHELDGDPQEGRFSVRRYVGGDLVGGESVGMPAEHLAVRRSLHADVARGLAKVD